MKKSFFALLIISATLTACVKDVFRKMEEGQVALTFDDSSVDNWYDYMPLLDSLHIKATFYVCKYSQLTAVQKQKLHQIEEKGHEIAFHTATHPDLVKKLQQDGMAPIINNEINKDLVLMRKDGFNVKSFAYPFGSHNVQLDCTFKKYFKTIRFVCNKTNWNKSLSKQSGDEQMLYGAGIDQSSRLTEPSITNLLDNARDTHDCLVLTAHEINTPSYKFHVSVERLKWLAAEAEVRNLRFITVDEIE